MPNAHESHRRIQDGAYLRSLEHVTLVEWVVLVTTTCARSLLTINEAEEGTLYRHEAMSGMREAWVFMLIR